MGGGLATEQRQKNPGLIKYNKFLVDRTKKKKQKYRNHKVVVNDVTFDSKKEANRYLVLLDEFGKGKIKSFELQPRFKFPMGFSYYADFKYIRNNKVIVEDTKGGYRNDVYRLKKKCFLYFYPKLELCEV